MSYIIVGLGNPGEEYEHTRHNVGRRAVEAFHKQHKFPGWDESQGTKALYAKNKIGKSEVELFLPETYMNKSGEAVAYAAKKHKLKPEHIVVVYDDIDLPLGKIKISFGRGSGGHNGVESIVRSLGTKDFVRLRIGVSPEAKKKGVVVAKKPTGEDKVLAFLMGNFTKKNEEELKKVFKTTTSALEEVVQNGYMKAMNVYNSAA